MAMRSGSPWQRAFLCGALGASLMSGLSCVSLGAPPSWGEVCVLAVPAIVVGLISFGLGYQSGLEPDAQRRISDLLTRWADCWGNRLLVGVVIGALASGGVLASGAGSGFVLGENKVQFDPAVDVLVTVGLIATTFGAGTAGFLASMIAPFRYGMGDLTRASIRGSLLGALAGVWISALVGPAVAYLEPAWELGYEIPLSAVVSGVLAGTAGTLFLRVRIER